MKVQSVLTLIVSKNYGRPHTWSLPAWKIYAGGVALGTVLLVLMGLSLLCVMVWPRWQNAEESLRQLRQERDTLREQVLSLNQEALETKEKQGLGQVALDEDEDDEGLDPVAQRDGAAYEAPIRITSLTARVVRSSLEVGFLVESQDRGRRNRGGYLFTVFENQDAKPPTFTAGPGIQINDSGFPESYKEGAVFPRVVESLALRRRYRLETAGEYYTHVTVYVFSLRGGLIAKERFPIDRSVFAEPRFQAVRPEAPATAAVHPS
ncbi:MAG: hypothetical protein ACHQZQ_00740 [SAR324 cluster bacterium]